MPGQRPAPQVAADSRYEVDPRDVVAVDEPLRTCEADLHHRQETLAAGKNAGVASALRLCCDRLVDGTRRHEVEPGREHATPFLAPNLLPGTVPPGSRAIPAGPRARSRRCGTPRRSRPTCRHLAEAVGRP